MEDSYTRHKIQLKTQWANTNKIQSAALIILELLFSMFCDLQDKMIICLLVMSTDIKDLSLCLSHCEKHW